MGVDCRITLPHRTRVKDVATVLAGLVGLPVTRYEHISGASWAEQDGVTIRPSSVVELCFLEWATSNVGRYDGCCREGFVGYHFESRGGRLMMPRSTPFWIAVGRRLADFFGGTVDYNDCDDSDVDYSSPEQSDIHAEDGAEWAQFQARLLAVTPLTQEEIDACRPHAAYTDTADRVLGPVAARTC